MGSQVLASVTNGTRSFREAKYLQADVLRALERIWLFFLQFREKYYGITATDDINCVI